MNRTRVLLIAALAAAHAVAGCGSPLDGDDDLVAGLEVQPDSITLVRYDSVHLSVGALNAEGELLTGIPVAFAPSDSTIVTVSSIGWVRSVGPIGDAAITVTAGGRLVTVPVRVFGDPASVQVAPADTTIKQGASYTLRPVVLDTEGDTIPGLIPSYQVQGPAIVAVNTSGVVTAVGMPGSTAIIATLGELQVAVTVTVIDSSIVARLVSLDGQPYGAAVSSTGTAFVTIIGGVTGWAQSINLSSRSFSASVAVGAVPTQVAFDAPGATAYVSNQFSQSISVVSVGSNTVTGTIPTTGDPVPMQVHGTGQYLFTTTNANRLYKFSLPDGTVMDSLSLPATSHHLLRHPNDTLLYVATREAGTVLEVNMFTMTVNRTFAIGGLTQAMALAPDNSELYVASENGNLYVVTLASGAVAAPVPLGGSGFGLTLGPDGGTIFVGLPFEGQVKVVGRASRNVLRTIQTGGSPREMAVDPATQLVVVANLDGWVDLVR